MDELAVPQGDVLEKLVELLKNTIALQTTANGLTDNLTLHLAEAVRRRRMCRSTWAGWRTRSIARRRWAARRWQEAGQHDEAKSYISRLQPLVHGEMDLANGQMVKLGTARREIFRAGWRICSTGRFTFWMG